MKIKLPAMLLLAGLLVLPIRARESESVRKPEWDYQFSTVKKLFDTPYGAVYEFPFTAYFRCFAINDNSNKDQDDDFEKYKLDNEYSRQSIISIQHSFASSLKKAKHLEDLKKVQVLDFKVRAFPALASEEDPTLRLIVTQSANPQPRQAMDLLGAWHYNPEVPFYEYYRRRAEQEEINIKISGLPYFPNYEWLSIRLIIDGKNNRYLSIVNGQTVESHAVPHKDQPKGASTFLSLGLCVPQFASRAPGKSANPKEQCVLTGFKTKRRQLLEITPPIFRSFDSLAEAKLLPPVEFTAYDYENYFGDQPAMAGGKVSEKQLREWLRDRNPDVPFAYALRLLYGPRPEPENAIAFLEKAAEQKHVKAYFHLALCYFRGYGVRRDFGKALKYLEKAVEFGDPDAAALYPQLEWAQCGYSLLAPPIVRKRIVKIFDSMPSFAGNGHTNYIRALYLGTYDLRTRGDKLLALTAALNLTPDFFPYYFSNQNIFNNPVLDPFFCKRFDLKKSTSAIDQIRAEDFLSLRAPVRLGEIMNYPTLGCRQAFQESDRAKQQSRLTQGKKAGLLECEVELLFLKLGDDSLTAAEFTPELDFRLGDFPMYEMIRFALARPDFPGIAEFKARDFDAAAGIWRPLDSPESNFLLGALEFHRIRQLQQEQLPQKMLKGDTAELLKAFELLERAAAAGIVPAQYLYPFLASQEPVSGNIGKQQKFLEQAIGSGHLKAAYFKTRQAIAERRLSPKELLPRLLPAIEAGYPEAFWLRARLRQELRQPEAETIADLKAAAELGHLEAWRELALRADDPDRKQEFWEKFRELDQRARYHDLFDFFDPSLQVDRESLAGGGYYQQLRQGNAARKKRNEGQERTKIERPLPR